MEVRFLPEAQRSRSSMVEHPALNRQVEGSSPSGITKLTFSVAKTSISLKRGDNLGFENCPLAYSTPIGNISLCNLIFE